MKGIIPALSFLTRLLLAAAPTAHAEGARNPIIHADIPDLSMDRVGSDYYMSSTTMHMSPGVPIMKSAGLMNWRIGS